MAASDQAQALQNHSSLAYWNLKEGIPVHLIDTQEALLDVWYAWSLLLVFNA